MKKLKFTRCWILKLFLVVLMFQHGKADPFDWDTFFEKDIECDKDCVEVMKQNGCCPDAHCRPDNIGYDIFKQSTLFWTYQTCPLEAPPDVTSRCVDASIVDTSDLMTLLPVTSGSTTFYNKFCAACYNITNYSIWSVNITCAAGLNFQALQTPAEIIQLALGTVYCSVFVQRPTGTRFEQCSGLFGGSDSDIIGDLGQSSDRSFFTNEHIISQSPGLTYVPDAPLSLILNFNEDPEATNEAISPHRYNSSCSGSQWTHNLTGMCIDIKCFPGKRLSSGSCISIVKQEKGILYHLPVMLRTRKSKTFDCDVNTFTKDIMLSLAKELDTSVYMCKTSARFVSINSDKRSKEPARYLELEIVFNFTVTKIVHRNEIERQALEEMGKRRALMCGEKEIIFSPTNELRSEGNRSRIFSQTFDNIPLDFMDYMEENSFHTVSPILICPYVTFESDQFEHHNENGSVTINIDANNITLLNHEYAFQDGNLCVCLETLNRHCDKLLEESTFNVPVNNTNKTIQVYLSYVCISLSLLGLLLTFSVYMAFPSLRSLPAKNNICLVFNLFWAQLLLQFDIPVSATVCIIVGAVIHFFWLSAIFSMNVCSYHMYSVFSCDDMAILHKQSPRKRLIKYIAYTYSMPILIIAATVTSQYIISDGSSFGYGGRFCYLASPELIGFAFALPLGIVLVLNAAMFGMAVQSISKTSRIQRELVSKGRHNLYIYIKLSTLTGLFWIFGILAEVLQMEVLVYLSIILNGSQGVFIFIACICNRRVLRLLASERKSSTRTSSSDKVKTCQTKSSTLSDTK